MEVFPSLNDALTFHAQNSADKLACAFIENDKVTQQYTFNELHTKALTIATMLLQYTTKQERALILLPQGLDYLAALLGCLYAGVIAVPILAQLPLKTNQANRIRAITRNAQPKIVITNQETLPLLQDPAVEPDIKHLHLVDINLTHTRSITTFIKPIEINETIIAFLQYTSGSTGDPKGVMLNHSNLSIDLSMMVTGLHLGTSSVFVSWLPLSHDMGLICKALLSIYSGSTIYLMHPSAFVRRPFNWLKAITNYRGTICFAPNFAYDMCINSVTANEKAQLDLSSWRVAANAAEPVRANTLKRFIATFSACGFGENAFCPTYGLAEATVFVSCAVPQQAPIYYQADNAALQKNIATISASPNTARILVGCGQSYLGGKIFIVNADSLKICKTEEIGEIWLAGPHIPKGYWNKAEINNITFNAFTADGQGPCLRTGDLGFLDTKNNLFITGRLKDLIIIHGRNFAAYDIEDIARTAHPAIAQSLSAAFSVDINNEERLILVIEIKDQSKDLTDAAKFQEIIRLIKQKIYEEYDIIPYQILFVDKGGINRTTSGKIQRQKAKADYLSNNLPIIELAKTPSSTIA